MRIVAALACAVTLVGCGTTGAIAPYPQVQVAIADGGLGIDTTYNGAAKVYLAVAPTLDPATKAKVKALFAKAYAAVLAADSAATIGDATTLSTQIAAATALIGQIRALMPAS